MGALSSREKVSVAPRESLPALSVECAATVGAPVEVLSQLIELESNGALLGVGGHLHDYGERIVLQDMSRKETVATLEAKADDQGHLESVPVKLFVQEGGYKFAKGDVLNPALTSG